MFSSTIGAIACTQAPAGYYAAGTGNTSATPCSAGTFSNAPGAISCTQAPAGSFVAIPGSTSATLCPAGKFSSNTGAFACTPAPAGSFVATVGSTSVTLCPAGTFSSTTGAIACTPAPAGSYDSGTGNTSATPCPANTWSLGGAATCTPAIGLLSQDINAYLSSNPDIANSLLQKAQGIASAPNANAKAGKLQAFINEVNAQTGKALTQDQANTLIMLAQLL
jgi:hypothetical protein